MNHLNKRKFDQKNAEMVIVSNIGKKKQKLRHKKSNVNCNAFRVEGPILLYNSKLSTFVIL